MITHHTFGTWNPSKNRLSNVGFLLPAFPRQCEASPCLGIKDEDEESKNGKGEDDKPHSFSWVFVGDIVRLVDFMFISLLIPGVCEEFLFGICRFRLLSFHDSIFTYPYIPIFQLATRPRGFITKREWEVQFLLDHEERWMGMVSQAMVGWVTKVILIRSTCVDFAGQAFGWKLKPQNFHG